MGFAAANNYLSDTMEPNNQLYNQPHKCISRYALSDQLCLQAFVLLHCMFVLQYLIGRYWEVIERLRVNQFFTAPTAVRLLIKSGDEFVKKYDRSSCRIIAIGT